jgi:hypothetical protein
MADASMVKTAPRAERGSPTGIPVWGVLSWAAMGAQAGLQQGGDTEYVPELMWPNSVWTYGQMRNDSQVDGLSRGSMLPITRWDWGLDQNNSDPALYQQLMRDTGLPAATREGDTWKIDSTKPIPRGPGSFDFHEHMTEALLATIYGHYPFELNADLIPPPDGWPVDTPMRARLHKVATRPPWTLTAIETNPADGELLGIRQLSQAARASRSSRLLPARPRLRSPRSTTSRAASAPGTPQAARSRTVRRCSSWASSAASRTP